MRRVTDIVGVWKGRKCVLRCRHPAEFEWLLFGSKDSGKREKRDAKLPRAPHHHDCAIVVIRAELCQKGLAIPTRCSNEVCCSIGLGFQKLPQLHAFRLLCRPASTFQLFQSSETETSNLRYEFYFGWFRHQIRLGFGRDDDVDDHLGILQCAFCVVRYSLFV